MPKPAFIHDQSYEGLIETLQYNPNWPEGVLKVDADQEGVGGDNTVGC